jgi:hypothetical protein
MSGLEILGVAASVVQVADAGLRLSKTIYAYSESVRSADARLGQFAQDVDRTSQIVRSVGLLFSDEKGQRLVAAGGLSTAKDCIQDCEAAFQEIEVFITRAK